MTRALPLACIELALLAADAAGQKPPDVTTDQVLAAWTARQDAVKSARFRLAEECIKPAGGARDGKDGGSRLPVQDTKCQAEHEVAFAARRYRHAISGARWSTAGGGCVPCDDVLTFDGELSRVFRPTDPGADRPQGSIRRGTKVVDARNLLLTPIFCCLRANEPYLAAFNPDELSVTGRSLEIAGRRCLEVVSERPGGRGILHVWVDPAMKFVPVRLTKEEGDHVLFEITIQNERHDLVGGLPTSWMSSLYMRKNVLTETLMVRVLQAEINPKLADSIFTIEFPPGTFLYDERTNSYGLVKEGNTKRKLTNEELRKPYSELLQLPGPTTPIDDTSGRPWWLWVAIAAMTFGVLWLSLWKWRRRRESAA
jgi:hypothetical protein